MSPFFIHKFEMGSTQSITQQMDYANSRTFAWQRQMA
jgi:hypothetical protein